MSVLAGDTVRIVTVVENRAREVAISQIDQNNSSVLELYLFTDTHGYAETLSMLHELSPNEILLPDSTKQRVLTTKILEAFPPSQLGLPTKKVSSKVTFISRQYFDQDKGVDMLKRVIIGEVDADLVAKYTVLAGSYCLLRYWESISNTIIQKHSIRVQHNGSSTGKMSIDRKTCANLELISNLYGGNQRESLFGVMNYTKTQVGARLLRSNLLRPSTDIPTIETRLDSVDILLSQERMLLLDKLNETLRKLPDLDKMLSGLVTVPRTITYATIKIGIDTLIYLKTIIQNAAQLSRVIYSCIDNTCSQSQLLMLLASNFIDPQFDNLLISIDHTITESTSYTKNAHEMRHQECFAIHSGVNGLLDVARTTFQQSVEDMYLLAEQYEHQHQVTVKVCFNASRGYHLSVPSNMNPLPEGFMQAVLNKRTISCTTAEVQSLADRAQEAITQALTITQELIQELLGVAHAALDALFTLTDSVALLDVLCSFADMVHLNTSPALNYVRPLMKDAQSTSQSSLLVIRNGRHPIIATIQQQSKGGDENWFISNDTCMSPLDNMHIISGCNGAGKTVYIKQVALLIIMAQIGSYIPASFASIPVRDRILSRLGTNDDMEHNLSSFTLEMKECAYILDNLTPRSLVIVDELGRGTSTQDGIAIAFSIAEALLISSAFTLFVTHFPQLHSLSAMYCNAKNMHLQTIINVSPTNDSNSLLSYLHEIKEGSCSIKNGYGIILAEICGFPKAMLDVAKTLQKIVKNTFPLLLNVQSVHSGIANLSELLQRLLLLKEATFDQRGWTTYLTNMHAKVSHSIGHMSNLLISHESRVGHQGGNSNGVGNTADTPIKSPYRMSRKNHTEVSDLGVQEQEGSYPSYSVVDPPSQWPNSPVATKEYVISSITEVRGKQKHDKEDITTEHKSISPPNNDQYSTPLHQPSTRELKQSCNGDTQVQPVEEVTNELLSQHTAVSRLEEVESESIEEIKLCQRISQSGPYEKKPRTASISDEAHSAILPSPVLSLDDCF